MKRGIRDSYLFIYINIVKRRTLNSIDLDDFVTVILLSKYIRIEIRPIDR